MASQEHLDWNLLKELECPVCFEYMTSPIKMCESGHNICNSCGSKVSKCPSCTGELTKARNFTLERIAATAIYPCKNREAGCEQTFTMAAINNHQTECLFQSRECPFTKFSDVKCPWSGILSDIGGHARSEHDCEFSEHTSGFEVTLQKFNTAQRYCKAIFIWGKLFYLVWETTQLTFYFSVFHFGHNKEAEEFIYEFKLGKYRDTISVTGVCRSYLQAESEVLKLNECVTLHYRTVHKYLSQNGDLSCEIEIRKKSLVQVNNLEKRRLLAAPSANPAPTENAWLA